MSNIRGRLTRLERRREVKMSWWDEFMEQPLPAEMCVSHYGAAMAQARSLVDDALAKPLTCGLVEMAANGPASSGKMVR